MAGTGTVGTSTFWTDTIGTSAIAAGLDGDPLAARYAVVGPAAAGRAGRPAVEIYAAGSMLDVMVAAPLAPRVLRGACSLAWSGLALHCGLGLPACPPRALGVVHPRPGALPLLRGGRDRCRVRAARPC